MKGRGGGERWARGSGSFQWQLALCACVPSGLCRDYGGLAEEECAAGGCSSSGYCFCRGESYAGPGMGLSVWHLGRGNREECAEQEVLASGGELWLCLGALGWVWGSLHF